MKKIDTGDRVLDAAIQLFFSTLVGGIISGLIVLYTKGLWKDYWIRVRGLIAKHSYNPLEFDPSLAPEKPANGTCYLFKRRNYTNDIFNAWFFVNHANKYYVTKNKKSLQFPSSYVFETPLDRENFREFEEDELTEYFPIWRHTDGYFVFAKSVGETCYIYSDSGEALKACCKHINEYGDKTLEYRNEKREWNGGTVSEFISDDSIRSKGVISRTKVFDTLFFTEKPQILEVLQKFKEKRMFPKHLPLDNKLGILLYGPPGTGKTGFISALSNYLERSIILVHTSRIRTRKQLDELFNRNDERVIYVLEEFDCMPGVLRRGMEAPVNITEDSSEKPNQNSMAYAMMLMNQKDKSEQLIEEYREERRAAQDKLDLGYLLTTLHGLHSADGRIVVATTNHPERIDPALLRPGRIGLQIHLTNCTRQMLLDILQMAYQFGDDEKKILEVKETLEMVEDLLWSPAEVLQLVVAKSGLEEVLEVLVSGKKSAY